MVDVPAAVGAAEPNVAAWGDDVVLSWIEPDATSLATDSSANGNSAAKPGSQPRLHALRFAVWNGTDWSEPRTIARGAGWFVNWADFPAVLPLGDQTLVAHWLQRTARSGYAYDVMLVRSGDGGVTWSEPVRPHRDAAPAEHGFVSFVRVGNDAGLVWLDGRGYAGATATKQMTVRYTTVAADGSLGEEVLLDERACDCCQTAAAVTADGPIVAYRDRTVNEIRDIAVTRLVGGRWTAPRPVHDDGWHINACPVNGPQLDAAGRDVVVAWYTAANDSPRVNVAFSTDAGATFGTPARVDMGDPLGRVDVLLTGADHALVVWLERAGEAAEVKARLVDANTVGAARTVATTGAQRASGFPRLTRSGRRVFLAWTDPANGSAVRAATFELPR
jgi:hypothetical protein